MRRRRFFSHYPCGGCGTIEQLIVILIRPLELVIGKLLPYVVLAIVNAIEVLVLGARWFDVPVR
ncbi:MAG: hypothetical protein NZ840_06335 [Anaerolineales bacterium]|nr:hypothetical protein [Anaerolineales bacterium]MDW8161657.1 hypothetical protein [Anaerolineales bacterium]